MGRLHGKVAIVNGGANGIGRAFCKRFAAEGAKVVVADVDLASSRRVAEKITAEGGTALAVAVDVMSGSQINAMVERSLAEYGQIDVLVNCAGIYPGKPFLELTEKEWDRVLGINLKGVFLCSQAVVRHMVERGTGKIVNIASCVFHAGSPQRAHYVASKAGVIGLTRAMARELGPNGINVNAIAPGLTSTESALTGIGEAYFDVVRKTRSIQRDESPEDLVGAALFFACSDSDFITGQTLPVEGGNYFV